MLESTFILITLAAMVFSVFLLFVPTIPVAVLVWAIAVIYGALTDFERFTLAATLVSTIFMLLSATSSIWMPILGYQGQQTSCMGLVAFFVGMIVGSALIPIPLLGTIIGGVGAVMLVEYSRLKDMAQAWQSGKIALRTVLIGMALEFVFAIGIIFVYIISVWSTAV